MSKAAAVSLLAFVLLVGAASTGRAGQRHGGFHGGFHRGFHPEFRHGFRSRVFIGVGPSWWGPGYWGPGFWGPAYWGPAYPYGPYPYWWSSSYYNAWPPAVVQEPQMYIQQQPATSPDYWYYCASAHEYYPKVGRCPEAWIKVPPTPE